MSMKAELGCVIDFTNPDIIVETEIWLSSSSYFIKWFSHAEYTAYHKDRVTGRAVARSSQLVRPG